MLGLDSSINPLLAKQPAGILPRALALAPPPVGPRPTGAPGGILGAQPIHSLADPGQTVGSMTGLVQTPTGGATGGYGGMAVIPGHATSPAPGYGAGTAAGGVGPKPLSQRDAETFYQHPTVGPVGRPSDVGAGFGLIPGHPTSTGAGLSGGIMSRASVSTPVRFINGQMVGGPAKQLPAKKKGLQL